MGNKEAKKVKLDPETLKWCAERANEIAHEATAPWKDETEVKQPYANNRLVRLGWVIAKAFNDDDDGVADLEAMVVKKEEKIKEVESVQNDLYGQCSQYRERVEELERALRTIREQTEFILVD